MSKGLWWVIGAAGLVWLMAHEGPKPASAPHSPNAVPGYSPSYSTPTSAGVPERGGYAGSEDEDDSVEEVRQAKQDFEDAADELRSAVNDLRHNRWSGQMTTIRGRLEDADDALTQLETLRPGDPAVQNARDEIDTMRSHLSRLHHENWRTVRPDLASSASNIEDEAGSVSEDEDD